MVIPGFIGKICERKRLWRKWFETETEMIACCQYSQEPAQGIRRQCSPLPRFLHRFQLPKQNHAFHRVEPCNKKVHVIVLLYLIWRNVLHFMVTTCSTRLNASRITVSAITIDRVIAPNDTTITCLWAIKSRFFIQNCSRFCLSWIGPHTIYFLLLFQS